jgi:hypothetical protein
MLFAHYREQANSETSDDASRATVIAETRSERNVEPSFRRTETHVVVACTTQRKNINATVVFFLIREFKTTPSFSNAKIEKKTRLIFGKKTATDK